MMFSFLAFVLLLFLININFLWLFGSSPRISDIKNPQQSIASEIYSDDGKMLGRFYRENRTPVEYDELSPLLVETLIATEDERYYSHSGIDFIGLFSAVKDWFSGNYRGASTISQQLIKNMYKTRSTYSKGLCGHIPYLRVVVMKLKEWIGAFKIEMYYSKEEVLAMYLNTVDFGNNTFGIKTASRVYFHTTPKELKAEQIAMLIGMLKAPSTYNPLKNPKNCTKRRNVVLNIMQNHKLISITQNDSLSALPLGLKYKVEDVSDGEAPYFRNAVAASIGTWCRTHGYDIYSSGLKIYTTLDSRIQTYAEEAVNKQMTFLQREFERHWGNENPWRDINYNEIPDFIYNNALECPRYKQYRKEAGSEDSAMTLMKQPIAMKIYDPKLGVVDTTMSPWDSISYTKRLLHIGFVAIEPQNRYVRAWVGDLNYQLFKYDHVSQAQRQPGSTFKLFVYTAAMAAGMAPCDTRRDQFIEWKYKENGKDMVWRPHNVTGKHFGIPVTLRYAFAHSINSIAVAVAREVGLDKVMEYAYRLGIRSKLEKVPSMCLGSSDVKLLDLVNSYATIIADGAYEAPVLVTRIEDRDGNIIWQHKPHRKKVVDYETAVMMQEMLKAGMKESGSTTQALRKYDLFRYETDFGGKTGTSSNFSDGWFVGVTHKLVGGAWVGGEQRCIHFRNGFELGEGGYSALPVFGIFMQKVIKDESLKKYRAKFPEPKKKLTKKYECWTSIPDSLMGDSTEMHGVDSLFNTGL
ncbi:MAG TPA: transglycosylase domain-containing protein [Bacteroidales bacterium]|nr:transglycosylase domain-containing protein [Bacteroidales bacterium]